MGVEKLREGLWRLNDAVDCTAYLAVGLKRAYMIDTGMGLMPLMPQIRAVTDLPVELLLTHAHPDHFAAAGEFERVWLCEDDREILACAEPLCRRFGVPLLTPECVSFFRNGAGFDAGGMCLKALQLPGHTPGSCAFGIPQWRELLTGDAIGSGDIVLMTLPGALSVSAYCASLERFVEQTNDYAETEWRGGHCGQAGTPGSPDYHPPCMRVALDMIELCKRLLARQICGEAVDEPNAPGGRALRVRWGTAGMVYTTVE